MTSSMTFSTLLKPAMAMSPHLQYSSPVEDSPIEISSPMSQESREFLTFRREGYLAIPLFCREVFCHVFDVGNSLFRCIHVMNRSTTNLLRRVRSTQTRMPPRGFGTITNGWHHLVGTSPNGLAMPCLIIWSIFALNWWDKSPQQTYLIVRDVVPSTTLLVVESKYSPYLVPASLATPDENWHPCLNDGSVL